MWTALDGGPGGTSGGVSLRHRLTDGSTRRHLASCVSLQHAAVNVTSGVFVERECASVREADRYPPSNMAPDAFQSKGLILTAHRIAFEQKITSIDS